MKANDFPNEDDPTAEGANERIPMEVEVEVQVEVVVEVVVEEEVVVEKYMCKEEELRPPLVGKHLRE